MLLERTDQLSALADALDAVTAGRAGAMVFVGGEAGVGKTALLREFCDQRRDSARILWGACEALLTPGPLGPLFDVAEVTRGELEELVSRGARPHEVTGALVRELARGRASILVLEDLHWADEATLDVLRLLARKVEAVPTLVLASYRNDELDRAHPLTLVLGELGTTRSVTRLVIPPLSERAVGELAEPYGVDAADLHRRTNGNPFYVTEVLAAGAGEIPPTVRDAVLARLARLSAPARALLEAIAIATPHAEVWLLEALAAAELQHLDECLASGVVASESDRVVVRHELARLAVEEALPPHRRVALHRAAAAALAGRPHGAADPARIAHHADVAGDGAAVLHFAPAAAARAASLGAHREAAAQYARALRYADALAPQEQAALLELRAYEGYLTGELDAAIHGAGARAGAPPRPGRPAARGRLPALALEAVSLPWAHREGRRHRPARRRPPGGAAPRSRARARVRQPRAPLHDRGGRRAGHGLERGGARARRGARRHAGAGLRADQHRRGRGLHRGAAGAGAARAQPGARAGGRAGGARGPRLPQPRVVAAAA